MEWRPIETAPRDGTYVLVFGLRGDWWPGEGFQPRGTPEVTIASCGDAKRDRWEMIEDGPVRDFLPTHWMPLPAPPPSETDA